MKSFSEDTIPMELPKISYGAHTTKGNREENQDAFCTVLGERISTFAVADGAGGHSYGRETSHMTIEAMKSEFQFEASEDLKYIELLIKRKYEQVNSHFYNLKNQIGKTMVTTLSMLNIIGSNYLLSNVGDTKIYQIRADKIKLISMVHNKAWELFEQNLITYEEYKNHKNRNLLTKAIGGGSKIEPYIKSGQTEKDDIYIICTDGVHNFISSEELLKIFSASHYELTNEGLTKLCSSICKQCLKNGSNDNLSIVAVKI